MFCLCVNLLYKPYMHAYVSLRDTYGGEKEQVGLSLGMGSRALSILAQLRLLFVGSLDIMETADIVLC